MYRALSRFQSLFFLVILLSYCFFPLAIAISTFAFPFLKYILVGTIVKPSLYIFSTQQETLKSKKTNIYTVKKGDSFYSIANEHNMTVKELMMLNKRINDIILIGDKLKVNPN